MKLNLSRPITCLITRGDATPANFYEKKTEILEIVRCAAESSVSVVQIREKNLSTRQLFELTSAAVGITGRSDTCLLVNDRADVALAAGADGVHLRSDSISATVIRANVPAGFIIGVSAHSLEDVIQAKTENADFALFGPVFSTPGKAYPAGITELQRICAYTAPFPVLALGGIDELNARSVLAAGATGFAAIRYLHETNGLDFARNLKNGNK